MSTKGCVGLFLFCLELELFAKIKKKIHSFYTLTDTSFINNSISKQNKKNPTHPFVDIRTRETCAKFQQKILNPTVVGARQRFQFSRQITWFLGNTRAFSKFKYWILHHLISIIKLQNNWSVKLNFMLIMRANLIKKDSSIKKVLQHRHFPVNVAKFFSTVFRQNMLG